MKVINPRNTMRRRSIWVALFITCIVILLGIRLFYVQIIEGERYKKMALNQAEGVQTLYSPRGTT